MGIYDEVDGKIYANAASSLNPISRAYHRRRYAWVREKIATLGLKKSKVLDIGCGSCEWNTGKIPVVGLDISKKLVDEARANKRLVKAVLLEFDKKLPFGSGSFDAVVMSEVLEHLQDPSSKALEIRRVLKKGGILLVTVPYDVPGTLWNILFPLQCFYMKTVKGDRYYANNCGHINHFDPTSLRALLEKTGFEVKEIGTWASMNIGAIARKK